MGALADASAKLEEISSEIANIDFEQEKEDAANFLNALAVAVGNLNSAFQAVINVVKGDITPQEPPTE